MPLTRSAARRSHRALASDDVLSTVLSFIDPLTGFGAATTSKTLRDAWRRRCRGMLRVHRQRAARPIVKPLEGLKISAKLKTTKFQASGF